MAAQKPITPLAEIPRVDGVEYRRYRDSYYAVGSDGSVWSCRLKGSRSRRCHAWRQIKKKLSGTYYAVNLYLRERKPTTKRIHILVLETFHGPRPTACGHTRHRDGNKFNNASSNLLWGTAQENADDRIVHGTVLRGERVIGSRLTSSQVLEIRRLHRSGKTQEQIAIRFGVTESNVSHICRRSTWKHLKETP